MKTIRWINNNALWILLNVLIVGMVLGGWNHAVLAQANKIDLQAVMKDVQQMIDTENHMTMVFWIPIEYWQAVADQNPSMTPDQTEQLLQLLEPYILIGMIDAQKGAFGSMTFTSENDIRANLRLIDSQGVSYQSLPPTAIDPATQNLLAILKPMLANQFGSFGQNFHFFLFLSKDDKGQMIASTKKEGNFSLKLADNVFKWRLPLGSLLPPKTCPKCGEQMSGAWKYCPWDGARLK
jgi:hypothetical protein